MDQLPITVVDIVLALVVLISAALAFVRGFVHEVLGIAAWIGAIIITIFAFPHAQPYAREYINIALVADAVTGLAIFIVALVVFTIISHAASRNVRNSSLGAVDRSLGLVFGVVRGVALICAAYLAMMWAIPQPEDRPLWIQNARSQPLVEQGAVYLASLLPASILERGEDALGSAADAANDAETLIDAGEILSGSGSGTTSESTNSGADSDGAGTDRSGYNDAERNEMDRVIQSTE